MKTTLLFLALSFCFNANSQSLSVEETEVQRKIADALFNEARSLLVEFVLKQDTARHSKAFSNFSAAKKIYDNLMINGKVKKDDWGTTIASLIEAKLMTIDVSNSIYNKSFRDEIMAETASDRTKKVKYNGVEYKLSKASKKHFENLNV